MTAPLSERAYASALRMWEGDHRMRRPEPADFAHLDAAPAPVQPAPAEPVPVEPSPDWDASAFDALPDDIRAGVMAGTASILGRHALEREAEGELLRPGDVHLHLTDPARYVDPEGRVDAAAIRRDIAQLVTSRPELARYGNRPGQEPHRPDDRRKPAPDSLHGAGAGPARVADAVAVSLARMQAATGVKFAGNPTG